LDSKMSHSLQVEVASCIARSPLSFLDLAASAIMVVAWTFDCFCNFGREYLDNVPLFQGCSEKMLDSISVLLREMQASRKHPEELVSESDSSLLDFQVAPEEYIYRSGEIASDMFLIVSGSVDELSEKSEVKASVL
jgi:hypothetical protein